MKIKDFKNFTNMDTLFIFDLDGTIVDTPSFEDLAIKYLTENTTIEDMLKTSVDRLGVDLKSLKWENGRIYVDNKNNDLKPSYNWVKKGKRLYLVSPNMWHISDISLPNSLKELSELYKSIENKCIVTARSESIREKIEYKLGEFGLNLPKYGLHMMPDNVKNAGNWKGFKIVEILKETGFKKAIFYDDNIKYIKKASAIVKRKMPNIDFQAIKV